MPSPSHGRNPKPRGSWDSWFRVTRLLGWRAKGRRTCPVGRGAGVPERQYGCAPRAAPGSGPLGPPSQRRGPRIQAEDALALEEGGEM
eukprot:g15871.t1